MPLPILGLIDDFDRANGALGNTSETGEAYAYLAGTAFEVDTNRAKATTFSGGVAITSPATNDDSYYGIGLTIQTVAGTWAAGVIFNSTAGLATCNFVAVDSSGDIWIGRYIYGSTYLDTEITAGVPVDVTAGDHTLVVVNDPDTTLTVWWDGVEIGSTTPAVPMGDEWGIYVDDAPDSGTLRFDDLELAAVPVFAPTVASTTQTGGARNLFYETTLAYAPSVASTTQTGGAQAIPEPEFLSEVHAPSVPSTTQTGGASHSYSDTPAEDIPTKTVTSPTWPTGYQYGPPVAELTVDGYPYRTQASCAPALNAGGTGSFTTYPPGPSEGDLITYRSGGVALFTGVADAVTTVEADAAEEAGQLVTVETPGVLEVEWRDTVIWPDIAAGQPHRLGPPPQDDREWGWPMSGLTAADYAYTPSAYGDNSLYGTADETFPLPDNWPDATAAWMWDRDPDAANAPAGWCYFRIPFGAWPGDYSLFLCAYSHAKLWIDGVLLAETSAPGATERVEVTMDWDFHLAAISGYSEGGRAGVLFTAMKKSSEGKFEAPVLISGGGWRTLAYPKTTFRATVGRVLRRLVDEARARQAPAGQWTCAFTDDADSNGTPWPTGEDNPTIFTQVGTTYYDALLQFAEDRIDFRASPTGRTLYAYVKDTAGDSMSMPWVAGSSADSLVTVVSGH